MGNVVGQVVLANVQKNVGYIIAVILIVGFVVAVLANMRRGKAEVGSEIELAANRRPYLDDEQLETKKLDRTLGFGVATLAVIAITLPLYWLAEPGRQEGQTQKFQEEFVARGAALYTTGAQCGSCHGPNGVGGSKLFTITGADGNFVSEVNWQAPALNTVLYRYSRDEVRFIITYGRGFSPMPAWGAAGGGPLTEQQITNLIDYLQSIQLPADQAITALNKEIDTVCKPDDAKNCTVPDAKYKTLGETLFNLGYSDGFAGGAYSCGRCHTKGWSYGDAQVPGGGAYGPNLTGGSELRQFDTAKQQIEYVSLGSVAGKTYGRNGLSGAGMMPGFGINPNITPPNVAGPIVEPMSPEQTMYTVDQIAAIVDYERSL